MNGLLYGLTSSKTVGGSVILATLYAVYNGFLSPRLGAPLIPDEVLMTAVGAVGLKEAAGKFKS